MYHDVSYLLSRLINGPLSLRQIYFASSNGPVPDLAYQVDFPRLEIVLEQQKTAEQQLQQAEERLGFIRRKVERYRTSIAEVTEE